MANEKKEVEYHVLVKVFVTGDSDQAIENAAQNAAQDVESLLTNRTIHTADCDVRYEVE